MGKDHYNCVYRSYLKESPSWLYFISAVLSNSYKIELLIGRILSEFDEQFLERATTLVQIFSHVQVVMEVGSSDKMERSPVLALALP